MALPHSPIAVTKVHNFTEFDYERQKYTWTIRNFSLCMEKGGRKIESPIFRTGDGPDWVLHLYPNGRNPYGGTDMCVGLYLHSLRKVKGIAVKYRYLLRNAKQGPVHHSISDSEFFYGIFEASNTYGVEHSFIKRDELISFLKDDELTICCELFVRGFRIDRVQNVFPVPKCTLSDDFGSVFNDQEFGDTIIQVGRENFLVYRGILQARSPVFKAMFQNKMEEREQNRVVITDFEPEVVEEMLTYIYTDKSPNLEAMAFQLLSIADKYNLDQLKIMSAEVLSRKLLNENAIETLILADLHGADYLKTFVINFMLTNKTYFQSPAVWERIIISALSSKNSNLVEELTSAFSTSRK